ncbi:hypothetical protein Dacsa_2024 [Dactylococcopsis salina PCC 8305]|uniref:Uncharacterized protein n=1 Tax=Dactylococcopsis salina (strain PCC 8305) TaxID=13035 RepID=K9YUV6_DACS8|nr:hypothetical protein Dacsa_2024 [Dactylococcopsis salina PCC 8305]
MGDKEDKEDKGAIFLPHLAFCLLPFAFCLLPLAFCLLPLASCLTTPKT